jgi:hypothetical protein
MSGVSLRLRARTSAVPRLISPAADIWGARPAVRTTVRNAEGIMVQHSRFVFLAAPMPESKDGDGTDGILWMLVSPNNRPLGRGTTYHETYSSCRQSVLDLQANCDRVKPVETTVEMTGQWTWRIELDGEPVAVSSRSYLRARECSYNLERFLEAVPKAEVVAGTRSVRRGRRHASVADSPSRSSRELRNAG